MYENLRAWGMSRP